MPRRKAAIAVLSIEGTNCDAELVEALKDLRADAERVHLKQFEGREVPAAERRRLFDYDALLLPGGFSAGDYVRGGAILAARMRASMAADLESFLREGRMVGGICNGFQTLIELGLLPGRPNGRLGPAEAALLPNDSGRYECRPTFVRWEGGRFPPLEGFPSGERFLFPSGHGEGKLVLAGAPGERLRALERDGQILFRWVDPEGRPATYPWNPNGSEGNVAGITNPAGNVFGLMPHPERAYYRAQLPDWTRRGGAEGYADGHRFLEALVRYAAPGG